MRFTGDIGRSDNADRIKLLNTSMQLLDCFSVIRSRNEGWKMRVIFILAAAAIGAGGLISTIKVPNVTGSKQVLTSYRADPQRTLKQLETAIFECVPDSTKSPVGVQFTGTVIAPFYVKILDLRIEGPHKDTFSAQLQKWIVANHPQLLTDLPDKDFLELVGYLDKIGDDDVENCILSSATSKSSSIATGANELNLRT